MLLPKVIPHFQEMLASLRRHCKTRLSRASAAAEKLRGSLMPPWSFLPQFGIPLDTSGRDAVVKPSVKAMILITDV